MHRSIRCRCSDHHLKLIQYMTACRRSKATQRGWQSDEGNARHKITIGDEPTNQSNRRRVCIEATMKGTQITPSDQQQSRATQRGQQSDEGNAKHEIAVGDEPKKPVKQEVGMPRGDNERHATDTI